MPDDSAGIPGTETVELAQAKNHEAFSQLYEYYNPFIYRYLMGLVGDRKYAEDLTQDTFLKVWENLPGLHHPSCFKSWLFSIARNRAIDYSRRLRNKPDPISWEDLLDERQNNYPGPEDAVTEQDLVRSVLSKLSCKHRECLLLQLAGFSHQEIADLIGLTKESVSTYISYARKQFIEIYCHLDALRKRR